MGAHHCMASEAIRLGRVRKREKEAQRAAKAQIRLALVAAAIEPAPVAADTRQPKSPFCRREARRKRGAQQKAETHRLKEDLAVSAAVKDLLKAIRESVAIIDQVPKDGRGRMRAHDVTEDGEEVTSFEKTSRMFKRFTVDERYALSVITRKHRSAAKRLTASISAARGVWQATLAEYERNDSIGSTIKARGLP